MSLTRRDTDTFPLVPGVYLFKDNEGKILYVGKAKKLRTRVRSYFRTISHDNKVQALLMEAKKIDYIETKTEVEALLLEAQLVQEHNPPFNILLKNDYPYVYLMITKDPIPQFKIVRNKNEKGTYFGPFIHKQHAKNVHTFLISTFALWVCNKKIKQGCLDYHLGRCAGICMEHFDKEAYLLRLSLIAPLLNQDRKKYLQILDDKIQDYTRTMDFEKARNLHTYRQSLETVFGTLAAHYHSEKYLVEYINKELSFNQKDDYYEAALALQRLLQLPKPPETIDCFDISHFQSRGMVGSCVRFTKGVADKNKCRRFMIKTLQIQNDYKALQEIVVRRYKKEEDYPDIIVIDGGKGQLSAVLPFIVYGTCVSLAKREETLYSLLFPDGVKLDIHKPEGKLLIALRDYAHHFALTYHRLKRSKLS